MIGQLDPACVFCQRIEHGQFERQNGLVVAFEPLNPVVPGHMLAVPTQHVLHALDNPTAAAVTMEFAARLAAESGRSCNLITSAGADATQTIFHLHIHVIPRTAGDGLLLPWSNQERIG